MNCRTTIAVATCAALTCAACREATSPAAAARPDPCAVAAAAEGAGDRTIERLQADLRARLSPARAAEHLGYHFVSLARRTHDPGHYTVAEQAAACVESLRPDDPSALLLRGHVLHQMHRFREAEAIARQLTAERQSVLDFGLLGDVLMEQGRLDEAAVAYQQMLDLKPFYQSYVRAAHLRWLRGDLAGATDLMRRAIRSASPRDPESIAWAYTRLASYELQAARLDAADRSVTSALAAVADYAPALLVRGRVLLANGKAAAAADVLARAAAASPLPEYQWALADALRSAGRAAEAEAVEGELLATGPTTDPRTTALFLATRRRDSARAVDLARRELQTRGDVFTHDALAWASAAGGDTAGAWASMTRALAAGTEDGRLFVHAAAIAAASGDSAAAVRWARKAHALRFTLLPSELDVLRRVSSLQSHEV